MNTWIGMGRLTKNPDMRMTQTGMQVARFTLAVDRRGAKGTNGEQQADFISCIAFEKRAEFVGKYLVKGTKVVADGHIQTGSYTNQAGQKVYTTDIIIDQIEFAESKASQDQQAQQQAYNASQNTARYTQPAYAQAPPQGYQQPPQYQQQNYQAPQPPAAPAPTNAPQQYAQAPVQAPPQTPQQAAPQQFQQQDLYDYQRQIDGANQGFMSIADSPDAESLPWH